jgi:steroid delta-isomerase-like uncharacterized protein
MTREEINQFLARRQEAWKQRDIEALTLGHSEDCVLESPLAGKVTGRTAIEKVYRGFIGSFPDLSLDGTDFIIDDDRVAQVSTLRGTDKGGFMGRPPTGKRFSFPVVFVLRLKDGLIVEERRVYDFTGMLTQVGVLKVRPL